MPIETDSEKWNEGDTRSDVRHKVLGHMQRNRNTAYTSLEVWQEVFGDTETPYSDAVCCKTLIASILEELCNDMKVECRMLEEDGETKAYYTFVDNLQYL